MQPENVGQQFKHLYRGVAGITPEMVSTGIGGEADGAGIHWTTDENVAAHFANPDEHDVDERFASDGVIIRAKVPYSSIVQRGTPEHEQLESETHILDEGSPEKEVTVRPGAPIHVTHLDHVIPDYMGDEGALYRLKRIKVGKEGRA